MFSDMQCSIGRAITGDNTSTDTINKEASQLTPSELLKAVQVTDVFAKALDGPFDEALPANRAAFKAIAEQYSIASSTLFCLYMQYLSEQ